MIKKRFLLLLVLTCSVGVAMAANFATGYEPDGFDELDKQKGTFKTTLVRPDLELSRYTEFQVRTVALVIRDPASANQFSTGRVLVKREKESLVPEFEDVVEFKRIFAEALASELTSSTELEQVESPSPSTLILQPVVTEVLISSSSKNKDADGRELPELKQGTIVFDLIDGQSGKILARFGEKRRCKPPKGAEKATGLWPNLEYWAGCAAADLSQELQRIAG